MPDLWIKICGLCTAADVEAAVAAGADALGFVFHEPSPRHLPLDVASALQTAVPPGVERVAVFLHPSQAQIDAVIDAVHPDWVQTDVDDLARLTLPHRQRVLPVLRSGAGLGAGAGPVSAAPLHAKPRSEPIFARVMLEGETSGAGMRAEARNAYRGGPWEVER